ncbi:hypothetical protein ERO13_D12G101200v2 [Gossypium hirsutum]|uniref:PGG domain-containing protein n=1 Tax=Gossypium hirsutum TaxID=3635 RepID=A0A1U8N7M9_GOSHI|nr:uncharacterized protein LOC107945577 [Gossypium hirsutum]KAG4115397.1 hypothetical protein ERO13_D12G101200v2 [Gossypium hirsutum]
MINLLSTGKSWYKRFQYDEDVDKPGDVRNILLIVATLIASVTFQAGVTPPGGVWQDDKDGHRAGQAIYACKSPTAYFVFLLANTIACSTSVLVIISLTCRFPFQLEIIIATISMIVTYGSAIFAVTPNGLVKFRLIMFAAGVPFIIRGLIQLFNVIFRSNK